MFVLRKSLFIRLVAIFMTGLFLSACAAYKPVPPAFHKIIHQPYTLDSGDQVRITVFNQSDLTNNYAVDKAGYIAFPLVGAVVARGQTTKQLEGNIARKLQQGFLRNPDVSIEVQAYRPFFILGEVGTAGQYTYVPGMTVQNAIAIAGGFTGRAEQENADVTRTVNGEIMTGRILLSQPILAGDTIFVRERLF